MIDSSNKLLLKKVLTFFITAYLMSGELIKLFLLEFKLAKRSAVVVLFCTVVLVFLIFSFWLLSLLIIIFLLQSILHQWLMSFIITALLNLLVIGILFCYMSKYTEEVSFQHTRKHILLKRNK
jgi:hypothetical protein